MSILIRNAQNVQSNWIIHLKYISWKISHTAVYVFTRLIKIDRNTYAASAITNRLTFFYMRGCVKKVLNCSETNPNINRARVSLRLLCSGAPCFRPASFMKIIKYLLFFSRNGETETESSKKLKLKIQSKTWRLKLVKEKKNCLTSSQRQTDFRTKRRSYLGKVYYFFSFWHFLSTEIMM